MYLVNYAEKSVANSLRLCRLIEQSFEMSCPDLFNLYKQDRLHGHDHVWNVLENCLMISSNVKDFMKIDNLPIDYEHLIAACLLHDTAGLVIDFEERVSHHVNSKKYIETILKYFNCNNAFHFEIERVFVIARAHRLKAKFPPHTLAEEIIALADGLDENMNRLYNGNKNIRQFFDNSLSMSHRIKVVMRRNLENESISREDPRNDTIMFMLDSLVRNSMDINPWKLVLKGNYSIPLNISDTCWQYISNDYFEANYSLLIQYLEKENVGYLALYINDFLSEVSDIPSFAFLKKFSWYSSYTSKK